MSNCLAQVFEQTFSMFCTVTPTRQAAARTSPVRFLCPMKALLNPAPEAAAITAFAWKR